MMSADVSEDTPQYRELCPLLFTLHFCGGLGHQHSKGADGSHYQSIYEPTEPSQPMMSADVGEQRYTTTLGTMAPTLFE